MEKISITRHVWKQEHMEELISDLKALIEKRYKSYDGDITIIFESHRGNRCTEQKETNASS